MKAESSGESGNSNDTSHKKDNASNQPKEYSKRTEPMAAREMVNVLEGLKGKILKVPILKQPFRSQIHATDPDGKEFLGQEVIRFGKTLLNSSVITLGVIQSLAKDFIKTRDHLSLYPDYPFLKKPKKLSAETIYSNEKFESMKNEKQIAAKDSLSAYNELRREFRSMTDNQKAVYEKRSKEIVDIHVRSANDFFDRHPEVEFLRHNCLMEIDPQLKKVRLTGGEHKTALDVFIAAKAVHYAEKNGLAIDSKELRELLKAKFEKLNDGRKKRFEEEAKEANEKMDQLTRKRKSSQMKDADEHPSNGSKSNSSKKKKKAKANGVDNDDFKSFYEEKAEYYADKYQLPIGSDELISSMKKKFKKKNKE